jgi:flavin-dependent dehydrogenase
LTPVGRNQVCVALITHDAKQRLDDALANFPELARKLHGPSVVSSERGAVTISRRLDHVFRGSTVLLGDASGSVDAITGDGLSLSFRQASALADSLAKGDLRAYESEHSRLFWRPAFMGRMMLLLDRSSSLRHRAIRALSSNPEIFAKLLAMHVGELSLADFVSGAMLPLGWRMLTT